MFYLFCRPTGFAGACFTNTVAIKHLLMVTVFVEQNQLSHPLSKKDYLFSSFFSSFFFLWSTIFPCSLTRPSCLLSRPICQHALALSVCNILNFALSLLASRQFQIYIFLNRLFKGGPQRLNSTVFELDRAIV